MVTTSSTCYGVVTFLTQWGKSASNFVAIISLVVKLLQKFPGSVASGTPCICEFVDFNIGEHWARCPRLSITVIFAQYFKGRISYQVGSNQTSLWILQWRALNVLSNLIRDYQGHAQGRTCSGVQKFNYEYSFWRFTVRIRYHIKKNCFLSYCTCREVRKVSRPFSTGCVAGKRTFLNWCYGAERPFPVTHPVLSIA
jgi:hypothetical protein